MPAHHQDLRNLGGVGKGGFISTSDYAPYDRHKVSTVIPAKYSIIPQ